VHGARALLEALRQRDFQLFILSGTLEERVREEAELLDLAKYFGDQIYGSSVDEVKFSKRAVLELLLREQQVPAAQLLSFGDGPVEIGLTKAIGGLAVAVASDEEENGSGKMHPQKRAQLKDAGADIVIPDYRDADSLVECLLGK